MSGFWLYFTIGIGLLALVGVFLIVVGAHVLRQWGRMEKPKRAGAAIVLGAYTDGFKPSRTLTARLKAALHLYRNGYVDFIITSGGRGEDETVSESTSMKRFLVFNGVAPEVILEDRHSTDTWENLRNSRAVMERFDIGSGVVVTSDYHLPRALAVARQLDMDVTGYAAFSRRRENQYARREVIAFVKYTLSGQASLL